MADFRKCIDLVLVHEGGYANVPGDGGGETFRGIARNFHGDWVGWTVIDAVKGKVPDWKTRLVKDSRMTTAVLDFYRKKYWTPYAWADVNDQKVAEIVFDFSILTSHRTAVKMLQVILQQMGYNLQVDGFLGPGTAARINAMSTGDRVKVFEAYKRARETFHRKRVAARPDQEKFLRGWLNRTQKFSYYDNLRPGSDPVGSGREGGRSSSWLVPALALAITAGAIYFTSKKPKQWQDNSRQLSS